MNAGLISTHAFDMPHYLASSSWAEHIPFAFDLVPALKPRKIVELGVFNGSSYFAFCQAVRTAGLPCTCYGIDNWYGDEHTSFYNEDIYQKVSVYNNATYAGFSTLLRSDFNDALPRFEDKSIDLLHIDGLHTYEAVKNDFESWLPKLSDSSIVLFHDTSVRDRGFGVFRLWEELSSLYPSFSFEHGYGLGVLATGKQVPAALLPLFNSTEKEKTRAFYHRLGMTFSERLKAEALVAASKESDERTRALETRVIQLQEEVETLGAWGRRSNEELELARQRFTDLHDRYEKFSTSSQEQRLELDEFNHRQQAWQQELQQIAHHILTIRQQFAPDRPHPDKEPLTNPSTFIMESLTEIGQAGADLKKESADLKKELESLNQQLHERAAEINALAGQIKTLTLEKDKQERNIQHYFKSNYQLKKKIEEFERQTAQRKETESHRVYKLEAEKKVLESRLQDIYSSDGYKLLSVYYRLKDKVIPENSGRQRKLKAFGRFVKKSANVLKIRRKIPTIAVSSSQLAQEHNVIPEVPAGISFPLVFPVVDQPVVSIIIPAYNNWAFTRNCIISIYQNTEDVPYEIIVGDNVSTDETMNFEKYFTNVTYLRNKENLGYIRNVNNAASHARGRFILTLNNDTTVTRNWLSSLLDVMNRDEKVGLVGSKLVYPNGSLQEAGGIIWKDASGWNYGREGDPEAPEYNYVKEVDYISGASNLIRTELWRKLKGLDERYVPAYFDDSDLAFSIRQLGYKTVYQPLSVVIHYEGMAHGTNTSSGTKKYQVVNAQKFIEKWRSVLDKEHFPNAENVFQARDKSRGKKTIVVIDHYVPHFDKDAGSRTTYQLLQLFTRLNYNVKFIGDNFYRHEPYTTHLQQMGIEVLYGEYYRDNWQSWIVQNNQFIDFFYINRPHISIKYINFLKERTKAKIIYYGHDLHFVRERLQYEIEKDPALLASAEDWKLKETEIVKKSDTILTLSYTEKEIIEKEIGHSDVRIMPAFFYPFFNEPVTDFDQRKDLLFIGGFGHKPNVDAVLWFAREVFPLIQKQLKDARFIIAGSNAPKEVTRLASENIDVKGYVSDSDLITLYRSVKLIVIPLRYGAGVKGKTVEAMYQGVPFVTTRFGIEGLQDIMNVTESQETAEEFAREVIGLYSDDAKLKEFSRKEIGYAKKYFSEENVADLIVKTFA